jgi:membrane protein DedA with SNARE-associated domain
MLQHPGKVSMPVWEWFESLRELLMGLQAGIHPELGHWSYILLAVLVATEGPLSTLIGASAAAAGILEWQWVLVATVFGNIVGDCLWYSVGYMGKMQWLYDHGRWLGLRPHHVARLEREMRAHATKLIIFAKIAYGLIVPTLVAAGMARVPWRKWFPVVFVVETLWSILLVWVGYHTTAFIQAFEHSLHAIGVAVLVGGVAFVLMRMLRKRIDRQELALDPLNQVIDDEDSLIFSQHSLDSHLNEAVVEKSGKAVPGTAELQEEWQEGRYEDRGEIHRCVALAEADRTPYGSGFGGDFFEDAPVAGSGSRGWSA